MVKKGSGHRGVFTPLSGPKMPHSKAVPPPPNSFLELSLILSQLIHVGMRVSKVTESHGTCINLHLRYQNKHLNDTTYDEYFTSHSNLIF